MPTLTDEQLIALRWLTDKLNRHDTRYQIVGGLADIAHGATRPLVDIDLYIDYDQSAAFLADVTPYVYWGPQHEKEGAWDITYLKLKYHDQKIEIGDSRNARFYDVIHQHWSPQAIDYNASVKRNVYNCAIDVMPLSQLITYKEALNREVDRHDVLAILNSHIIESSSPESEGF